MSEPVKKALINPSDEEIAAAAAQSLLSIQEWIAENAERPLRTVVFLAVAQDSPDEVAIRVRGSVPDLRAVMAEALDRVKEFRREVRA